MKKYFKLAIFMAIVFAVAFIFIPKQKQNFIAGKLLIKYKNSEQIKTVVYHNEEEFNKLWLDFKNDKNVQTIEKNVYYTATYLPADPLYPEQWAFSKIKVPQAWDISKGSPEVVVAVLDTGVDLSHPDLKENIWKNTTEIPNNGIDDDHNGFIDDINGWDFVNNRADPRPQFTSAYSDAGIHHGTVIAGLISAQGDNTQGVVGVSYHSQIMSLKVLDGNGTGDTDTVINAINYAINKKVDVINMSFVGPERSELLYQALKRAYQTGIVIVAAAGNDTMTEGDNLDLTPMYPACFDSEGDSDNFILGVAAVDNNDKKAIFSDFGTRCIDVTAPGTRAFSTLAHSNTDKNFKDYYGGYWSGTSVATPLVSGTAALIKSVNHQISPAQVIETILKTADSIDQQNPTYIGKLGKGRLNTYRAVSTAYTEMINFPQTNFILTGPGPGLSPQVRVLKSNSVEEYNFLALDKNFKAGLAIASGDVDGDKQNEIVVAAGPGGKSLIRVLSKEGEKISNFYAFKSNFKGGLALAVGDVDGDGQEEILTALTSEEIASVIKIFDYKGNLKNQFFAFGSKFKGGLSLAAGDLDSDGIDEIVVAPLTKGGPQIRVFDSLGNLKMQFFAFLSSFRGGIRLAIGDVNNDFQNEIIASVVSSASPYIRVFDNKSNLISQFLAYHRDFRGGVFLAVADLNRDGQEEIITGAGPGGGPQVRIFDYLGRVQNQFFAYAQNFRGGVCVSSIDFDLKSN